MQILLFFLLLIFLIIFPIVFFILRIVGSVSQFRNKEGRSKTKSTQNTYTDTKAAKKVFDKSEGEYVDYEEIKDDTTK